MRKFKTQICLISQQSTPNITPLLDEAIAPDNVILCITDQMIEKGDVLKAFIESKRITCRIYNLDFAYDFKEIKEKFLELAAVCDPTTTAVNLTGGTKLMTIAAQEVFGDDFTLFYVIPEYDQIIMISDEQTPLYEIADRIKFEDFFAIHGYTVTGINRNKCISHKSRELFDSLIKDVERFAKPLGYLNKIAASLKHKNKFIAPLDHLGAIDAELFALFQNHGAITYFDDKKIEFNGEEGRQFCNGFWFEDFVYLTLRQMADKFQDIACSIEIENRSGVKNEIDAAFIENNTLHLIECKTSKMDERGSDVLYKVTQYKGIRVFLPKGLLFHIVP